MPARGRRTRDHLGNFGEACYGPSRNARAGASYPRPVGRDVASLTRQVEMPARGASYPRLRHRVEFTTSPWSKCPRGGVVPATESPRLTPVRIPSKCPRGGVVPATGYLNTKILTCDQSKCPRAGASYPRQDLDHEHVLGRRESKCPRGGVVPATSALGPRSRTSKSVEMPARGRRTRDRGNRFSSRWPSGGSKCPRGGVVPATWAGTWCGSPRGGVVPATGLMSSASRCRGEVEMPATDGALPVMRAVRAVQIPARGRRPRDTNSVGSAVAIDLSKCPRGGVVPATCIARPLSINVDGCRNARAGASYPRLGTGRQGSRPHRTASVAMPARGRRTRDGAGYRTPAAMRGGRNGPARGRRTRDTLPWRLRGWRGHLAREWLSSSTSASRMCRLAEGFYGIERAT